MLFKRVLQAIFPRINYYYQFISIFQHPTKKVLTESYIINFSGPEQDFLELCARSFQYDVDYTKGYRQKEIYTVQLNNIEFLGNSGALIQNNKVVVESVFDQMRLTKSPAFRAPDLMRLKKKEGVYTSVMHLPWAEFSNYHWFLDCLPRLVSVLKVIEGPVILIIPQNIPAFQLETLQFLNSNNPDITLQKISMKEKWAITTFIFPSFISNHYSGYLPQPISDILRTKIWEGYRVTEKVEKDRIFISRSKTSKRRLINEAEIIKELKALNFKIIYAEDLTYPEQVQLFYNAEIVVGVHGAGLTNILFSKQVKLLELHPAEMVRSHYFMICKALGFAYEYLIGSKPDDKQDFTVDLAGFKETLKKLIA